NFTVFDQKEKKVAVFFLDSIIDHNRLEESLLDPLLHMEAEWTVQSIFNHISLTPDSLITDLEKVIDDLHKGRVFIYAENEKELISYVLHFKEKRALEKAETQSLVIGPKIS